MNIECNCDGESIKGIIIEKGPLIGGGGLVVMRCDTCQTYPDDTDAVREVVRQFQGTFRDHTKKDQYALWFPPADSMTVCG
jgi:hypothetical protein